MSVSHAAPGTETLLDSVQIDPQIAADPALRDLVLAATEILDREIVGFRWNRLVTASWTPYRGGLDAVDLALELESDGFLSHISRSSLADPDSVERFLRSAWGRLLEARSHSLLDVRRDWPQPATRLEGTEALDQIIDSVADYTEKEGREPTILKLPIRYATALMKLGPSYWGEFYDKIRETGLRAFQGQVYLGMSVELVMGVDAELQLS